MVRQLFEHIEELGLLPTEVSPERILKLCDKVYRHIRSSHLQHRRLLLGLHSCNAAFSTPIVRTDRLQVDPLHIGQNVRCHLVAWGVYDLDEGNWSNLVLILRAFPKSVLPGVRLNVAVGFQVSGDRARNQIKHVLWRPGRLEYNVICERMICFLLRAVGRLFLVL